MRRAIEQKEQRKSDTKNFIATVKKYTDLKELDAAVIREFIDRIKVSATEKYKKKQPRRINIVYNFIDAFDFNAVSGQSEIEQERETA